MDLNMKTEDERQWASQGFNEQADYYDKFRLDYPEELVKTIIDKANLTAGSKLLEIGSGTGRATLQFADFGFEIVCIEPAIALIEIAKTKLKDKNIEFMGSTFEDYAEPSEYFDVIISAQAFHWVTQPLGYEKCSKVLKKGGCLVPFWNVNIIRDDVDLDRELWSIITKYEGYSNFMPEKDYVERMESITSKIVGSGLFSKPEIIHFYKEYNFTANDFYNYMLTVGAVSKKADAEKQACHEELTQLAKKYNGIKLNFHYELYFTQKL